MPFDLTVWTMDLVAAGIGGLLGGTIGSCFRSYYGKKAYNRAIYEDLPSLLKQEFAKVFEQEAGRRPATHQDIENVLHEVRAVTKETETIKVQIGAEAWTRQMAWQQKKETYFNVVKTAHEFQRSIGKMRAALDVYRFLCRIAVKTSR